MKLKVILSGILAGLVAGLFLECLAVFWLIRTAIMLPLGSIMLAVGALGGLIGFWLLHLRRIRFNLENLPASAADYIKLVIRYMRYRKAARQEVADELTDHFEQALKDCQTDQEKQKQSQQLIDGFGNPKLLAVLLRRAKKRCRPLWKTIVARAIAVTIILGICYVLYVLWFVSGKPSVKVDYLALINQKRPDAYKADNAWPDYEKAIGLLVVPKWNSEEAKIIRSVDKSVYARFSNIDVNDQKIIRNWIAQNDNAWQEYIKGSKKSYCFKKSEYNAKDNEKWIYFILLPEASALRYLHYLGLWRARIWADEGNIKETIDDLITVARADRHLQKQQSFMVYHWIGTALTSAACRDILGFLAAYDVNDRELNRLANEVNGLFAEREPQLNLEGHKLIFLDLVQHLFTEGGPGGGHLVPAKVRYIADQLGELPVKKNLMRS